MNPIDQMLLNHANKIEVWTYTNPRLFGVCFSSPPSEETILPLFQLIETKRFDWATSEETPFDKNKLSFRIKAINVIPISAAIEALRKTYIEMGYEVVVKIHENHQNRPQPCKK